MEESDWLCWRSCDHLWAARFCQEVDTLPSVCMAHVPALSYHLRDRGNAEHKILGLITPSGQNGIRDSSSLKLAMLGRRTLWLIDNNLEKMLPKTNKYLWITLVYFDCPQN